MGAFVPDKVKLKDSIDGIYIYVNTP